MKAKKEHIIWYNHYYKIEQKNFTSWYVSMLPELIKNVKRDSKILEIGCGQSKGLRFLVENEIIAEQNIYGIDQSSEAVEFSKRKLKESNIEIGDAYKLNYENNFFDAILLMEVIEHIEDAKIVLDEIFRVLKPGGKLFLSFPNYLNVPWLIVRILSEKLNRPSWINLQPVDKIYSTLHIIKYCKRSNLKYINCLGSNYFPPILYKYEKNIMTKFLNKIKLSHASFHPVLIFVKT